MHLNWFIIRAILNCHYKAWLLYKLNVQLKNSGKNIFVALWSTVSGGKDNLNI